MKTIKFIIGLALLVSIATVNAAPSIGWSTITDSSTLHAKWAGTNYAIIPLGSRNGGEPLVTFIQGKGTNDAAIILYYFATNSSYELSGITNSTTSLSLGSTNGFNAGQFLLIQHNQAPNERFGSEPALVSSVNANGTNVVLREAPVNSVLPGDKIWQLTPGGSFLIGSNATGTVTSYNGVGLASGQRDVPFLFMEGGATNTQINVICATALSDSINEK